MFKKRVRFGKWVKDPYVKECHRVILPKSPSCYVQPCFILFVGRPMKGLSCQWLKWGLNPHIICYVIQQLSKCISDFIMSFMYKAPCGTLDFFCQRNLVGDASNPTCIEAVPRRRTHVYSGRLPRLSVAMSSAMLRHP